MKAAMCRLYGSPDVIRIEEVEDPVPGEGEVLLRVRAAGVNPLDSHIMKGRPLPMRLMFGLARPKDPRLGRDVAGVVEAIGPGVTRFKPGDEVFGASRGAFAELACTNESRLAAKPANMSFAQAAGVAVAGLTALQGFRKAGLRPGMKVLVNGASGGVGTFAVQIAKDQGAWVTAVCGPSNLDLVRKLGADRAIDYTKEDFTTGGGRYDIIFDLASSHSFAACKRTMTPDGVLVGAGVLALGTSLTRLAAHMLGALLVSRFGRAKFITSTAQVSAVDLDALADLMAAGKIEPVVDKCYSLAETAQAIRHVAPGHARGKVIIEMEA
jgi:NADPH:quinone reductase-like Zn-dependent oxidoreductase